MSPVQTWLIFYGLIIIGLAIPFMPALRTMMRGEPRSTAMDQDIDAPGRIASFRTTLAEQFTGLLKLVREEPIRGGNENGHPYLLLGYNHHLGESLPPGARRLRSLVLAAGHLDIPGELICDREIFAEGRINIGHNAIVKAVLSHRDIAIGPRARVTRWVRSDRRLDVAEGASLKGLASAGIELAIARRTRFEHLDAPRIVFGRQADSPVQSSLADDFARYTPPSRHGEQLGNGRNLSVPPGHTVKGDLIVSGKLHIGEGCRVFGQLRADKGITIERDVVIEGSVYADGPISTGSDCVISGPIVSRSTLNLGPGCQVGKPEAPSTLAAETLLISESCVAYGTARASRRGEVIDARSHS